VRTLAGETQLAVPIGENKVRNLRWADDEHLLVRVSKASYFLYETNEFEVPTTVSIDVKAKKSVILFDHDPKFSVIYSGQPHAFQINGHPYAFATNVPKEGQVGITRLQSESDGTFVRNFPDLWKIDLETNKIELFAHGSPDIAGWVVDPTTDSVAAYANFDQKSSTWTLFHGSKPLMSKKTRRLAIGLIGLGRTPGSVLVLDQTDGDKLIEVEGDGTTQTLFENKPITDYYFSSTTGLLQGVQLRDADLVFYDQKRQARMEALSRAFSGKSLIYDSWTDGLDEVVLHTDGVGDAGTYYLVNMNTHRADVLDNDFPGVPNDQVGAVRLYTYKASDGMDLDGVLTLPPGREAKGLPVVVLPHGGPIGIYDRAEFDWMAQAFASRGYAVFQPNYRGSGGHGAKYKDAGFGEFGRKMLTDMSDGLASLAKDGVVDPKRACIVGFSYGGYAAMAGITVQQGIYRCAVAGSGISDISAMTDWIFQRDSLAGKNYWRQEVGVGVPGAPSFGSISPTALAKRADAPLLLIHGTEDSVVPYEQSKLMLNAMNGAHKPVQMITTKGEDHWLSHQDTRIETLSAALDFVQKENPPN
jgi:dipeptidyl aminopeptidase/acylaminoacyl peptidase